VNVAIAQRLVRQICAKCRVSAKLDEEEMRILEMMPNVKKILTDLGHNDLSGLWLYKGAGCEVCGHTGFSGRIGIFEVMEMSPGLRELIVSRASSDKLLEAAKKDGMTTMLYDGIKKAFSGTTTIMEVARVTKE
jgi:type II secretory ATPase GspE/PulE/Tfp pilus assembly ATPase PilB-like protein